jgi:hypothetical protein
MKVLLTYRNSKLNKEHQFGLMLTEGGETQYRWLWFYLGQQLPYEYRKQFALLPYSVLFIHSGVQKGKVLKEYSQNDMLRLALLIIARINKQIEK